MTARKHLAISILSFILVLSLGLANAGPVLADEGTPTEPPTAAPAPTDLPSEPTQSPVEELPVEVLLAQVPENTDMVVLNEANNTVTLASQAAAEIIEVGDPIWCPNGVTPVESTGGCTASYTTLLELVSNLPNENTNGTIWILAGADTTASAVTIDGSVLTNLRNATLTLQGGWGGLGTTTVTSSTPSTFTVPLTITSWNGDVFVNDITINNVSTANSLTVYTDGGDIALNNVDVTNQTGKQYTAYLDSNSGNITVQNGSNFDGRNSGTHRNRGFYANTDTGMITIAGTSSARITFQDAQGGSGANYNGATLSAPTVSLSYVYATDNDGNGIAISNATSVTLNNVISSNSNNTGNGLSGVLVNGTGSTVVGVSGGTFADNGAYGIEVTNGSLYVSGAACPTTGTRVNGSGCYSSASPGAVTSPSMSVPANLTVQATSALGASVTFTVSATDFAGRSLNVSCTSPSGSTFSLGTTTVDCSASDVFGTTVSDSFTVTVQDTSVPTITFVSRTNANINGWNNSDVTVTWSCTDSGSGVVSSTVTQTISTEGAGQSVIGTCQDNGGNTASDTYTGINIDKTKPVVSGSRTPSANADGWNNTDVVVSFSCADSLSGVDTSNVAGAAVSTEGSGQSVPNSGACTDRAGNVADVATVSNINIDNTKPVITGSQTPAANGFGWNNTDVTVSFNCADPLAGVAANSLAGATLSAEGAGQSVTNTGVCTDKAGNSAESTTVSAINIDKTLPSANANASPAQNANGWNNTDVTVSFNGLDDLSGIDACSANTVLSANAAGQSASGSCTDKAGNTSAPAFASGINIDKMDPLLTLPPDFSQEATSDAGAIVTYSVSASDNLDGSPIVSCLPASGSAFPLTVTTVSCSALDQAGNSSAGNFDVSVVDTTIPLIAPQADMTAEAPSSVGVAVTYVSPSTSDAVDGARTATCSPASGSTFPVGNTVVTCTAQDSHGNAAVPTTFVVQVLLKTPTTGVLVGGSVGGAVESGNAGLTFVPLTVGNPFDIRCAASRSHRVEMQGIRVTFNSLCGYRGLVEALQRTALPGSMPNGTSFVGAFTINLLKDGKLVDELPADSNIQISFQIPARFKNAILAVYMWDGTQWVEFNGEKAQGFFNMNTLEAGTFLVIRK